MNKNQKEEYTFSPLSTGINEFDERISTNPSSNKENEEKKNIKKFLSLKSINTRLCQNAAFRRRYYSRSNTTRKNPEFESSISKPKSKKKKVLDFNSIQEQVDLYLKNSNYTPIQAARTKEKIEDLYRTDLINQFKTIDNYSLQKKDIEQEIFEIQKEIDKSKNKLFDLNGGMNSFYMSAGFNLSPSQLFFNQLLSKKDNLVNDIRENNMILSENEKKIIYKKKQLEKISFLIKELRFKKDVNIRLFIKYYCKLMSDGEDIRDEGLSWILYRLLELGYDINTCQYPVHITKKHFEYLQKVAKIKIEREKIKITYNALQAKYKNKFQIKKSQPNIEFLNKNKGASSTYDKFLIKYFNDKNAEIHYKSHGVEYKVLDYLNSGEKEKKKIGIEGYVNGKKIDGIESGIDPQIIIDEIHNLKVNLDKIEKNLKDVIKEEIKEFKDEYEELRLKDFNKYCFIYQCLFGISMICT